MTEQGNKLVRDLVYLASCALHNVQPSEEVTGTLNLQALYPFCQFHSVTAIVCMAVEGTAAFQTAEPELQKKWQDAKNKAIRKTILLDAEREKLFAWMDEQGIWHLPLKGIILKEFYPKLGMRQMADNDILYDPAFQQEVKRYMSAQGYQVVMVGKSNHDVYHKPPVYNFELHTALFQEALHSDWGDYYRDVKSRLEKDEGNAQGYHFREEDFYLYILTHGAKHFRGGGTGLRSLMDVYVYLRKKGEELDWDYIHREEEKLGISDFARQSQALAEKLFSQPNPDFAETLTQEEREQLAWFAGAGTYGTLDIQVKHRIDELRVDEGPIDGKTKRQYYLRRLFPNLNWYQAHHPFCYRHRWSIPFFVVFRTARGLIFRGKKIRTEIRLVKQAH
jgi:hypothetical protein